MLSRNSANLADGRNCKPSLVSAGTRKQHKSVPAEVGHMRRIAAWKPPTRSVVPTYAPDVTGRGFLRGIGSGSSSTEPSAFEFNTSGSG